METRRRSCIAVQTGLAADYEQRRRMLCPSGEHMRQEVSHRIASMIATQGPAVRLRHMDTPMLRSRPLNFKTPLNITKKTKTHTAGGWPLLQNAMRVASDLGHQVSEAGHATAATALRMASDLGHSVSDAGQATAAAAYYKATDLGSRAFHMAEDFINYYVTGAQRTYLKGQEEIERVRRITSEDEHWAMLNAFATAKCMRGFLQEKNFYQIFSARNVEAYWAKLLEQCEMRRRCSYPMPAQKNAKKLVGMLVNTRHNPHSDMCIPSVRISQWHNKQAFVPASLHAQQNPSSVLESTALPNVPSDIADIPLESRAHIPAAPPMPIRSVKPVANFSSLSGAENVVVFYPSAEVKIERADAQGNRATPFQAM